MRTRPRHPGIRRLEQWLGGVAAIGAAVVVVLALSSTLVNREIAWTASRSAAARPLIVLPAFADSTALFGAVDRYVEDQMRAGRVPGLALVLVHDDRIVHARGFGITGPEGRPVTPETPFILGSLSKAFTAVAILQLADQRRVALDAPVQRYLPWFSTHDSSESARITIRELLNHTSGIPKSAGLQLVRGAAAATRAQERRLFVHARLVHAPGTEFVYSNANYWLLGLVLETVTDTSYATYVQRHIFDPLGMTHSYTSERAAGAHGLAQGYRIWFGYPRAEELSFYARELAVGYLISSAGDMGRFLIAQLNGGIAGGERVISPAGLRDMSRPPPGSPYAMGWLTDSVGGVPVLWHTGALANYHGDMLLIPSSGWGVVQLANTNNFALEGQLSAAVKGIAALLLGYEPPRASWLGFRTSYVLIIAACLAWAAWRVGQVVGLRHWRGMARPLGGSAIGRPPPPRHPAGALIDPGVAIGLVVGVPLLLGSPPSTLQWFVPDLSDWLAVNAVIAIAMMTARLVLSASDRGV